MNINLERIPNNYVGNYPSVTIAFRECDRGLAERVVTIIERELEKQYRSKPKIVEVARTWRPYGRL